MKSHRCTKCSILRAFEAHFVDLWDFIRLRGLSKRVAKYRKFLFLNYKYHEVHSQKFLSAHDENKCPHKKNQRGGQNLHDSAPPFGHAQKLPKMTKIDQTFTEATGR